MSKKSKRGRFGEEVGEFLALLGVTQTGFAELVGVHGGKLSRYMTGRQSPSLSEIRAWSDEIAAQVEDGSHPGAIRALLFQALAEQDGKIEIDGLGVGTELQRRRSRLVAELLADANDEESLGSVVAALSGYVHGDGGA